MFIDFRHNPPATVPVLINDSVVETVSEYKYLGTIFDNKLTFDANTDRICKKANQRLFFLRKLRSFQVDRTLMRMFYSSFIESVLTFSISLILISLLFFIYCCLFKVIHLLLLTYKCYLVLLLVSVYLFCLLISI